MARFEQRVAAWPWRRLGQGALVVVVLSGVGVAWWWRAPLGEALTTYVAEATGATVQSLVVSGAVYSGKEELQQALGLGKGDSLVGFDAAAARRRIEALPWVRLASVDRQLPATVKVTVYEHVPLARVVFEGAIWVVNQNGERVVEDRENRFANLPLLQGEGAGAAAGALFGAMEVWPQLLGQLREAKLVGGRRWDLRFVSGVVVQLPEQVADYGPSVALPILAKLEEARHVLALNGGEVDLRLPDRVVLRLPEGVQAGPVVKPAEGAGGQGQV
ncbi:MAG: FtsQ-type POTRA domain-containing protein [Proteobacteria bacterium]|nr:FtsQ-type POTRA domain-containing protein [Pseudomonadota bacterium]